MQCLGDGDCSGSYPACNTSNHTCVECGSDANCHGSYPACNTTSHTCVECVSDANCSASTKKSCNTSNQCVCRLPSSGNLLKNPGFDTNLSNWDTNGEVSWHGNDADGCMNSGEALSYSSIDEPAQCVAVSAGVTYWFGASFNYSYLYNGSSCIMYFYSAGGCNELYRFNQSEVIGPSGGNVTIPPNGWQHYSEQVTMPAGTISAKVACNLDENTSSGNGVDQIYVNRSADSF